MARAAREVTDRCPTCRRRIKRSTEANRKLWALYHLASEKLHPDGQTFSAESFHLYYKSRFLGCDEVKMPNNKTMLVPKSTADLDVDEFGAFLDRVQADLNERGVYLEDAMFAA